MDNKSCESLKKLLFPESETEGQDPRDKIRESLQQLLAEAPKLEPQALELDSSERQELEQELAKLTAPWKKNYLKWAREHRNASHTQKMDKLKKFWENQSREQSDAKKELAKKAKGRFYVLAHDVGSFFLSQ
jgi:hypothetical protein